MHRTLLASVLLVGLMVLNTQMANAAIVIDNFQTEQMVVVTAVAPPATSAFDSLNPTLTAIGSERDLFVEKTLGAEGDGVRVRINPLGSDLLRHSQNGSLRGRSIVSWDGVDGSSAVDFDGLGGIDLLADGATAFEVGINFSDVGGPLTLTVWDFDDPSGATSASGTVDIPGAVFSGTIYSLPFAMMTPTMGTVQDILDSVGAIQMEIDGTAVLQTAWDVDVNFVRTGGIMPEPSTYLIWSVLMGSVMCAASWRKRREASNL